MSSLCCALLVDDDPTTNYLNRKLLEKLAVADRVLVALNGQEALQVLAAECPETEDSPTCPVLIFLDINMPLMNGFAFLEAYQQLALARRRAIVIVMLTTSVHPHDMQRLEALPVAGFLNKPLNSAKIHDILQTHFPQLQPEWFPQPPFKPKRAGHLARSFWFYATPQNAAGP